MESKECRKIRELFSDHYDGDLNNKKSTDFRNHLEHCPSCDEEYKSYESLLRAVSELPQLAVSDSFETRLRARIRRETVPVRRSSWWRDLGRIPVPVPIGAAALLFLGIIGYQQFSDPSDSNQRPTAATETIAATETAPVVENTRPSWGNLIETRDGVGSAVVDAEYGPPRPGHRSARYSPFVMLHDLNGKALAGPQRPSRLRRSQATRPGTDGAVAGSLGTAARLVDTLHSR